ncbi:MAG: TraR/DksA family transcriptional regulator [Zavarzinella sp.]
MARRDALQRINRVLTDRRTELIRLLRSDLESLGHDRHASVTGDAADFALELSGEELTSQLAEIEARELNQIDRALIRIRKGVFGICEGCSKNIPIARLNALPYSELCIECQRLAEKDSTWLSDKRRKNAAHSQMVESESLN